MLTALALPWAPAPASAAQTAVVEMKRFAFDPRQITMHVGDTVRWEYKESSADPQPNCESVFLQDPSAVKCPGHSTTEATNAGAQPLWDSGVHRAEGFPFSFTFTKAGTYHYICTVHGGPNKNNALTNMEGDVIIVDQSSPTRVEGRHVDRLPRTGAFLLAWLALGLAVTTAGATIHAATGDS
jgi:plastocyanin